jgi:starch-binding outer membrane protein SusE/F
MKNKFKFFVATIAFLGFVSCEDEQDLKLVQPNGTFSITTPSNGDSIILTENTPTNPGISLTWTKMNYTTPTEVTYAVELAPNGSDFSDAQVLTTTTNNNVTIQSSQFNLACLIAGATPFVQSSVDIRIKATVGDGSQPVYTEKITYSVTCYGCLGQFAVGAGIPAAGWNWDSPLSLVCDNNVLTTTVSFANDTFRFFTEQGNWGSGRNYPYYTNLGYVIGSNFENANDGDSNFRFIGVPGVHRLKIDENKKIITAFQGATAANSYWLVGQATPGGWSWTGNNESELGVIGNGIYEAIIRLKPDGDANFRVWLANDGGDSWGSPNRNYPSFVNDGYTIDSELVNANDGDSNFKYIGPDAVRKFRINTVTKVITVE